MTGIQELQDDILDGVALCFFDVSGVADSGRMESHRVDLVAMFG